MCYDHVVANWKMGSEKLDPLDREVIRKIRADRFKARVAEEKQFITAEQITSEDVRKD